MRVFHFNEQPYYPAWSKVDGVLRVMPASAAVDPEVASELLSRYIDEWALADDLGLDLMVNEHHSSLTCMSVSCSQTLTVLARETKRARILGLGYPVTNRMDPFRVAEEIAFIDVLSKGRLEFGLVKGAPEEPFSSNLNPVRMMSRYWEATDLIVKALTKLDGPFIWEGEHFHYQYVNVIPRAYQKQINMWIPGSGEHSARQVAQRGYVLATFLTGSVAKQAFEAYRDEYLKTHKRPAALDRLTYLAIVVVGETVEEARALARKANEFRATLPRSMPAHFNPPGYIGIPDNARALVAGANYNPYPRLLPDGTPLPKNPTEEQLADAGMVFWGTPDMVVDQITRFYKQVGGFGNLIAQVGGTMTHEDTVSSIRLFAKEVLPRLQTLSAGEGGARKSA